MFYYSSLEVGEVYSLTFYLLSSCLGAILPWADWSVSGEVSEVHFISLCKAECHIKPQFVSVFLDSLTFTRHDEGPWQTTIGIFFALGHFLLQIIVTRFWIKKMFLCRNRNRNLSFACRLVHFPKLYDIDAKTFCKQQT